MIDVGFPEEGSPPLPLDGSASKMVYMQKLVVSVWKQMQLQQLESASVVRQMHCLACVCPSHECTDTDGCD